MTLFTGVLYLLSMNQTPIRAVTQATDLQVEHVDESHSTLTVTIPIDLEMLTEQELIYRNKRYSITEINRRRNDKEQDVIAESVYMALADIPRTEDELSGTVSGIGRKLLADTNWELGTVAQNLGTHNLGGVSEEDETPSVLATLRLLANVSESVLEFDTMNRQVNFLTEEDKHIGHLFRYGKNVSDITKTTQAPLATTIYPTGKDGLTIESVNDGDAYVEDFGYYLGLGYTMQEARQFRKVTHIKDERFIYAGNLKREAERRLETLAYPRVTYETQVSQLDRAVNVGDYGYVVDEELDIKVFVKIVRLVERENYEDSEVELNYLIPGLASLQDGGGSGGSSGSKMEMVKNESEFTTNETNYQMVTQISITNTTATHFTASLKYMGEASHTGVELDGFLDIDGLVVDEGRIRKTQLAGWDTNGFNVPVTHVPEGSHYIRFMLRATGGTFTIPAGEAILYVESESLAGGMSAGAPIITVSDEVTLPDGMFVDERVKIELGDPPEPPTSITITGFPEQMTVGDTVQLKYEVR